MTSNTDALRLHATNTAREMLAVASELETFLNSTPANQLAGGRRDHLAAIARQIERHGRLLQQEADDTDSPPGVLRRVLTVSVFVAHSVLAALAAVEGTMQFGERLEAVSAWEPAEDVELTALEARALSSTEVLVTWDLIPWQIDYQLTVAAHPEDDQSAAASSSVITGHPSRTVLTGLSPGTLYRVTVTTPPDGRILGGVEARTFDALTN